MMNKLEYDSGVELLRDKCPTHPLLSSIERGHTRINVIYLQQALASIQIDVKEDPGQAVEQNLYVKKTQLYGLRAKLSNQFHDCKSDVERASISDQIIRIQDEIRKLNKKIAEYEDTGTIQQIDVLADMPTDLYELYKVKENARKNIPRLEKNIEDLLQLSLTDPRAQDRLNVKEDKLKKLKLIKAYAEQKIKDSAIHQ